MKYKIAVVEDNKLSSDKLIQYLGRYTKEREIDFEVYTFFDGDEITFEYEAKYDIIFLDIEMKRQDGMATARKIRELDQEVIIIFITNMSQYAIHGYAVDAMSFLLKPVPYFAFSQELEKSIKRIKSNQDGYIIVPSDKGLIKVNTKEIIFIESVKHQLFIYTTDEEYVIRDTMKQMESDLAQYNFYRCHSGYLVNLLWVKKIVKDEVIVGDYTLKISRPRKKEFIETFMTYIGEKK